jgi:exportin-1
MYAVKYEVLFVTVMERMGSLLPPNTNIPKAYKDGSDYDQQFIQTLALFLTTYFRNHLSLVEKDMYKQHLIQAHYYLVAISEVDDKELFKTCLEYWNFLTQELFFSEKAFREQQSQANKINYGLMLSAPAQTHYSRKIVYTDVLSNLRVVLISKMAKPEEVIIVEDENGQIVKEYMKDVDNIVLYKQMKETLVFLTHLDFADTERIMTRKLQEQVNGINWSWNNLNTLCWAIGSISGAMDVRDEKRFLVTVIKDLLNLCENKKGKENKAVVASNIMYVVGQYPRFLIDHWKFLKTVVNKLFEFMHELFPGVQEMACETFVKISKKCRRKFVTTQVGESRPFIEDILHDLASIISDLEPAHVQIFFEAVGYMISSGEPNQQEDLINKLMFMPNQRWQAIMAQAGQNMSALTIPDNMKDLVNLLKTNVAASKAIGSAFISQMSKIYREMLEVYKAYSRIISEEIERVGPQVTQYQNVKSMRAVKKEILKLTETFIVNTKNAKAVVEHFVPLLLEATLGDYKASVPDARDPGVLSLLAVTMNKLKDTMIKDLPKILENVLECTLPMITKNFEDYPEHRVNLFTLLRSINKYCFLAFLEIPQAGFKLVIDSILWSVKHNHSSIYETGLNILLEMLTNVEKLNNTQILNQFHKNYFLSILNDVFYVLTDTMHKSGFDIQSTILHHMFSLVQSGRINIPVYDTTNVQPLISNQDYIKEHISTVLSANFRNLTKTQVAEVIALLFSATGDEPRFKGILKDFLVQMKEFSQHFLHEELERRKQATEALKREVVPGLGTEPQVDPTV